MLNRIKNNEYFSNNKNIEYQNNSLLFSKSIFSTKIKAFFV